MNVSEGDQAVIIFSIRPKNVGRIVKVSSYIGKFKKGEIFNFRGMICTAAVDDHYWWIEADDLEIGFGPSPRAYIADSWLRRIKPKNEKKLTAEEIEDQKFAMDLILG
jgi:hypothetical protein